MQTSNSSYNQFKEKPYHRESPLFSNQKIEINTGKEKVKLFLDITKRDVINEMYFELEGSEFWSPFFSFLCFYCEGKKVEEVLNLDNSFLSEWCDREVSLPLMSLPLLMLKKVIYRYKGEPPSYAEIAGEAQETLYCRCFGVYESQLVDILLDHPDKDIKYFSDQTKAGTGCASCVPDINLLIQRVKDRLAMTPIEGEFKRTRPLGKTPIEFSLFLQDEFNKLRPEELEILGVDNYNVSVRVNSGSDLKKLKGELEHLFFNEHSIKLNFILL